MKAIVIKIWCWGGVAVVLLLCAGADAADKVRLSVSSLDTAFLTPAVAHKRGFFKEEGIEAEIIRMNANVSITALATGDVDYTMIFGSVIRAAMRGLPGQSRRELSG
jgi:ABC-type nitrate/sulfonate/bicarbonate transport system substrate-binding protein